MSPQEGPSPDLVFLRQFLRPDSCSGPQKPSEKHQKITQLVGGVKRKNYLDAIIV